MKFYPATHPDDYYRLDTSALRDRFLIENIRPPAGASLSYVHDDRAIAGGVTVASELPEHLIKESDSAAWRDREIGIFNLGYNPGRVRFNGESFELGPEDALYLGMGAAELILESCVGEAFFFIGAAPAHRNLPTRRILKNETEGIALGSSESANERVIRKYICPGITESCQLTMGITSLEAGSIWNTMPCHLHHRRMEIYCYYGLPENGVVFHQMGLRMNSGLWPSGIIRR